MPALVAENLSRGELERASSSIDLDYDDRSSRMSPPMKTVPVKSAKVVKQQPIQKEEEKEVLSAMPDPLNRKWHDCFYRVGDSCFQRMPLIHDAVEAVAPDTILEPKGALEKTCGFIILGQMIVFGSYIFFGITGYEACRDIRFLSLAQDPDYCAEVKNAINDKFSLDDNGYWDTFFEWSFAESMCGGNFVDFETTDTDWLTYSKGFWKIMDDWNTKWSTQASVDNLMAMVVSEEAVSGDELLLANVLADPVSLMNTNFKDAIAVNNLQSDGSFILNYGDLDERFYLSAARSYWSSKIPKWKFAANNLDDALNGDDGDDPTRGVMINKYSLWVAGAVNMGIIQLKDLTKLTETSVSSAYSVTNDDYVYDDGDDSSGSGSSSSCSIPSYYADGYCDSANNVAACDYDGGDCCESTCGVTYEPEVDCGTAGYNCLDPDASDFGSSDAVTYDDDAFDDAFTGGNYYYGVFDDDFASTYGAGDSCVWYDILLLDSQCDGWEGNYLHIGSNKFTLDEGCNGTDYVCLPTGNTYKPYACGGNYPSEISWVISAYTGSDDLYDDDFSSGGGDDDDLYKVGGGSALCDWEYCGSVTLVVGGSSARRLSEKEQEKLTPPSEWAKMKKMKKKQLIHRRKLQANGTTPSPSIAGTTPSPSIAGTTPSPSIAGTTPSPSIAGTTPSPSIAGTTPSPSIAGTTPSPSIAGGTPSPSVPVTESPTHAPTIDNYYNFGLTDYVLFKYYEEMDPIQCAYVNGSQYCWVKGNAGERGTEDENYGAYLFPIIQHYNKDCYNCSSTAANNDEDCNDVDLEVLLFFNPLLVSQPHFVHTYNATYQEERRKYDIENAGLDGLIYLNMYGGVKYLNELYYAMPDTHCTKPIAIAKGVKTKNAQACGTKYQKGLLTSKKKSVKRTAEKSYCQNTPTAPQERYFECRYSPQECVSTAIAEASGQAALVSSVATLLLVFFAVHVLGVPKAKRGNNPEVDVSDTGFFGSMAMKAKGVFQSAKEKMKEAEEKKKQDGEGGDIEMSGNEGPVKVTDLDYIMEDDDEVTLESLQQELIEQRIAQDAKVQELNAKIDKLLSAKGLIDVPSSLSEEEEEMLQLWAWRLYAFYQIYCPTKMDKKNCQDTAYKFKGREGDLFSALYHKYKVEKFEQTFHSAVQPISEGERSANSERAKNFTPSSTPSLKSKELNEQRLNHGSISKNNQADL